METITPGRTIRSVFSLLLAAQFILSLPAWSAAPVTPPAVLSLSSAPMTTATTTAVPPNLMFIMDDSGSMGDSFLPDEADNNTDIGNGIYTYGYLSAQCNGVAYNPSITYTLPVKADGTSYPAATFGSAWSNGFASSGSVNLANKYYYRYTGSQPALSYTYNTSGVITSTTFYKECTSREGNTPGSGVFTKVTVTSASADAQNYANWYSYYRTRLLMMKSAAGLAFKNVGSDFRVGFTSISYTGATDGGDFLHISDFTSDGTTSCASVTSTNHKQCWYSKLYAQSAGNYTPLRSALAKVGKIYAGKLGADPVQYACQKNFTLLSTDGYWNTHDETATYGAFNLDGTMVGQQDGYPALRPLYDGGNTTTTITTTWSTTRLDTSTATTPKSTVSTSSAATPTTTTTVFQRNQYSTVNPSVGTSVNNSSITRPGNGCAPNCVVTITTSSNHGFVTGDYVTVAGAGTSAYNGTFQITKVSNTQYTYVLSTRPSSNSGSNGTSQKVTCPSGQSQLATQGQRQTTSSTSTSTVTTTTTTPSTDTAVTLVTVTTPWSCTAVVTNGIVTTSNCPADGGTGTAGTPTSANGSTTTTTTTGTPVVTTASNTVVTSNTSVWANFGSPTYSGVCLASPPVPSPNPSTSSTVSSGASTGSTTTTTTGPTTTPGTPSTVVTTGATTTGASTSTSATSTTGYSNTLADVAMYYYNTDLRDASRSNCTGALGAGVNVCQEGAAPNYTSTTQNMVTFTLGLGVKGVLNYSKNYRTDATGDYHDIVQGTKNWPDPQTSSSGNSVIERIDDLWHAAVDGHGIYFSAGDPTSLAASINETLAEITAQVGTGAAAATSNLEPVSGDNFAYVASYTTKSWTGNLEARTIDVTTGVVSPSALWCVENIAASSSGATACTGTMNSTINTTTGNSDTRTIYFNNGGTLSGFSYGSLSGAQQAWFDPTQLSQYATLSAAAKANATGTTLVNYLRGQWAYEGRVSTAANQIYRSRDTSLNDAAGRTMGDFVGSQPVYVKKPYFSYNDPGYADFKAYRSGRAATVFIGSNDGMLHAFDASNGNERWAFVPSEVMRNMYKLADDNYANNHKYYVDGSPTIADICVAHCADAVSADWRTILVGGMNGGGKGFYALDITDPASPAMLWELSSATDNDMGYSFGTPIITKKSDDTWVVLLTSGYNNNGGSNSGKGVLYVVDPISGSFSKIVTTAGSNATPSGLSRISAWADDPNYDNKATNVFGGDLQGNVWHFDINAGTVSQVAVLKDSSGNVQPITTSPVLALVDSKKVVYIATGKFLELSDVTATPPQVQSLYAIKYPPSVAMPFVNPRSSLVQQTLTNSADGSKRSGSRNAVSFTTGNGWYVDFPDSGERNNVNMQLVAGTLLVPTNVPLPSICEPSGYSWLNYFDYLTGKPVMPDNDEVSTRFSASIVGLVTMVIGGKPVVEVTLSNDPTPQKVSGVPFKTPNAGVPIGKRVSWRELVTDK